MRKQNQQPNRSDETRSKADEAERAEPGTMHGAAAAGRLDAIGPTGILALQRTVGNAAVTHLTQRALAGPDAPTRRLTAQRSPGDETNIDQDDESRVGVDDDLVVGGIPVVLRLRGDGMVAGGHRPWRTACVAGARASDRGGR